MASKKLKKAMEEIKFILERYDVGAAVVLADKGDTEFYFGLTPTWSIISHDLNKGYVHVKALREDYPDEDSHTTAISDSINMVMGLRQCTGHINQHMTSIVGIFEKQFKIDFQLGEFEPYIELEKSDSVN